MFKIAPMRQVQLSSGSALPLSTHRQSLNTGKVQLPDDYTAVLLLEDIFNIREIVLITCRTDVWYHIWYRIKISFKLSDILQHMRDMPVSQSVISYIVTIMV